MWLITLVYHFRVSLLGPQHKQMRNSSAFIKRNYNGKLIKPEVAAQINELKKQCLLKQEQEISAWNFKNKELEKVTRENIKKDFQRKINKLLRGIVHD